MHRFSSMDDHTGVPRMRVYLCSTCARRCLVVGDEGSQRCICGGELTPAILSPGQYELIGQSAPVSPKESHETAKPTAEPGPTAEKEADLGYGQSHGYDNTHGGPTGPGDAPAR
jgi:hypothetical protein